jgi:hypothetical protein
MVLKIAYRYKGFDHLVADAKGNLYLLPHFCYRRTVWFKKVKVFDNGGKKSIKYHGSNVSFKQLKQKAYAHNQEIKV